MTQRTDLYAVLGLTPLATQEQIRHSYRALLRQNHPDTSPFGEPVEKAAATATLQELTAAYAILGDPTRRARYDHRTSPQPTTTRTPVRPTAPLPTNAPDRPPIQAGPVRWHTAR